MRAATARALQGRGTVPFRSIPVAVARLDFRRTLEAFFLFLGRSGGSFPEQSEKNSFKETHGFFCLTIKLNNVISHCINPS